jgi:DNA repair ATPase RecN
MIVNSKRNHNQPISNPSLTPEQEELQALFPLLEALVNQNNQIQAEQAKISQRVEKLATENPYLPELMNLSERLSQIEKAHKQINQTQSKLIDALDLQAQNQERLSLAMIQSLKNLQPDKPQQHEELENLKQNISVLRQKDFVSLKQSVNSLVQGVNNLTTQISTDIRQAVKTKTQGSSFNWTWRELFFVVITYSFVNIVLSAISFQFIQQQNFNQNSASLEIIYQRLNWTNTKLQRIEKKLGTAPKQ